MIRKDLIAGAVVSLLALMAPPLSTYYAQAQSPAPGGKGAAIGGASGSTQAPQKVSRPTAAAPSTSRPSRPAGPGGVVRKSKAYWENYQSDIIRQVFDGGFGSDISSSSQFRLLYSSYVENFSKKCRAYLPADHTALTVTPIKRKSDGYGHTIQQSNGPPVTLQVDSRFAPKYQQYVSSLGSSGENLGTVIGVLSGKVSMSTLAQPDTDMDQFFVTEKCQSATMRQMGENLLRAANSQPSLQESGATVAGAAVETDKSAPVGRFTHLVDGCNAFYRDPKNARFRKLDTDAWCKCLDDQLHYDMSAEEQAAYANDFGKFRREIGSPQGPSSPATWARLNPKYERCVNSTR